MWALTWYLTLMNQTGFELNIYHKLIGYYIIPEQPSPEIPYSPSVLGQSCPWMKMKRPHLTGHLKGKTQQPPFQDIVRHQDMHRICAVKHISWELLREAIHPSKLMKRSPYSEASRLWAWVYQSLWWTQLSITFNTPLWIGIHSPHCNSWGSGELEAAFKSACTLLILFGTVSLCKGPLL